MPDSRPEISYQEQSIHERLKSIYSKEDAKKAVVALGDLIHKYRDRIHSQPYHLSEKDTILITYGDQIQHPGEPPLETLLHFLDESLKGIVNSVHILPFYPYSSDDGFSVVNYSEVDPKMGSWNEIEALSHKYRLMVDGVINHISQFSEWFKAYLAGNPEYSDFFIELDPNTDLSMVVRPRATPLLSEFVDQNRKSRYIWTTFSKDQVDLNYGNYKVLIAVLDALFYYIEKGATLIRLDAIAFIWKEPGTHCVHLPQTHELIQLMREVLHEIAPEVIIITETNVPHSENISYFGSGDDEAQMVYNFALPPLLVHAVHTESARTLTEWAKSLSLPSDKVCFFNFTASHDGCGLRPVSDLLSEKEIMKMVEKTQKHGGLVSFRDTPEGTKPYELNCSYIDMLTSPDEPDEIRIKRMMVTQAAMLAMPGVPGIYFHSLVGSRNYHEGVKLSGINRTINREKLNADQLGAELADTESLRHDIFTQYLRLIEVRTAQKAFDPFGSFEFLQLHQSLFAILQLSASRTEDILALHNFSKESITFTLPESVPAGLYELIQQKPVRHTGALTLGPYAVLWLKWHDN